MINQAVRDELMDNSVVFENPAFDNSIIGVSIDGAAIYDYDKMIAEFLSDNSDTELTELDAIEWIDYNTIGGHCQVHISLAPRRS